MKLKELVEMVEKSTDEKEVYVLLSMIIDAATDRKDLIKSVIEDGDLGSTEFSDLGKTLNVIEVQKSALKDKEIKEKLSDQECRDGLKVTETLLKSLKRKDLLTDEYKTVTTVKQVRVTTIKANEKESA